MRPSNIGFIIPDENGRTNKLQRYINKDITIRMPDDKKVTAIKWLAVWVSVSTHRKKSKS